MDLIRYLQINQSSSADWLYSFFVRPVFKLDGFAPTHSVSVELPQSFYDGKHTGVLEMMQFLHSNRHPAIVSAWIYGSLAENKVCDYSDFDGILAIDASMITGRSSLAALKNIAQGGFRIMQKIDPLQHHGWAILPISQNQSLPSEICNPVLFEQARLLHQSRLIPAVDFNTTKHPDQLLRHLINTILKNAGSSKDFYHFKWLLSQCLLIPSAFIEAKTGQSHSKATSFDHSKELYPQAEWRFIDDCSKLRAHWGEYLTEDLRSRIISGQRNQELPDDLKLFFEGDQLVRMRLLFHQLLASVSGS